MKNTIVFVLLNLLSSFSLSYLFAQVENVGNEKFLMNLDGHPLKIPYYSNHVLFESNPSIEKAIIVIHGVNRNADEYFDNMEIAATTTDLMEKMLIVAPQFLTETDIDFHGLDEAHLYWSGGGWIAGSNSRNEASNPRPVRIPSYAVLDSLLIHLTRHFPNLSSIVFTGHSAGGQVTQRMAATSPITNLLCENFGYSMRYVVANPSSYVYMDGQRKLANTATEFGPPTNSCTAYNEWKYGLDDMFTYPKLTGIPTIRANYKNAKVTYLLGELDNNPNSSSLDTDCEAKLQGEHRLERGIVYFNYLQHYYGPEITSTHDLVIVPNVGHDNFEMYNSSEGIDALFGRANNACASTVSTKELLKTAQLNIFPNPTSETLNIQLPTEFSSTVSLFVFDMHGRQLLNQKIDNTAQLNISNLENGIYLLQIASIQGLVYQRFVVN